jgi:HlyD family secretion protein
MKTGDAIMQQLTLEPRAISNSMGSLRRHALLGLFIIVLLVGGLGGWAGMTEIAGAVVANGTIVVEGGSRRVQHPEGGVVSKIMVKNDDHVDAGELLVRLDDVSIRANLDVVLSQAREAIAKLARLSAESTGADKLEMPAIAEGWPADPVLSALLESQDNLRRSRKAATDGQVARLNEQISQQERLIEGLQAQQAAGKQQIDMLTTESQNLSKLLTDKLIEASKVNSLKRDLSQAEGEQGRLSAAIASAGASIAELELQRAQVYDDFKSEVLTELQTTNQAVAELMQNKIAAEDRLSRIEIHAPISGTVHESVVQTVGGVVGAGETLMLIVPEEKHLLIETRVNALDVDKVHVDQQVVVRMSGLDTRTTPELNAVIQGISPDLSDDPVTGAQYYAVRVDVPNSELAKLPKGVHLVPGMPAQAFIQTGERTVWSYIMHPIAEQLSHTFRED